MSILKFCAKKELKITLSMNRERKWAAGVYDPSFGFIVAGGWNDVTAEKTLDGETFTPIGNSPDMTFALRNSLIKTKNYLCCCCELDFLVQSWVTRQNVAQETEGN